MKKSFNTSKHCRGKKGFSLSETLVVVAIIGILAALSFVSVISYQRDLARLEMDATAKEIFLAAQEHLTIADGQLFLGLDAQKDAAKFGTKVDVKDKNGKLVADNVYYFVVSENKVDNGFVLGSGTLVDQMLPYGAIEETVRSSGSYIIRYQTSPAQILDVFYTEPHGKYPHSFEGLRQTEYDHLFNNCRTADVKPRRNYNFVDSTAGSDYAVRNAVIGYYGGGNSDAAVFGIRENGDELIAPILQVENGDRLVATVIDPNTISDTLTLHIRGLSSDAERTIVLHRQSYGGWTAAENPDGLSYVTKIDPVTGHVTYEIVLDDITTPGGGFAQKFGPYGFIPGEDIEIYADARDLDTYGRVAQSAKYTTNSLFGDVDGDDIEITSLRHLENLDPSISAFDPDDLSIEDPVIRQTSDIDFDEFLDEIRESKGLGPDGDVVIYKTDENPLDAFPPEGAKPNTYIPITPDYHMDYDGQNNTVSNITIDTKGDAGFFGTLSDPNGTDHSHITVRDVELVDFSVKSEDGNAGVLAGTVYNANITGVLVRNTTAGPEFGVTAGGSKDGNAGGLVGEMNGGSINLCAASTYVRSTSPAGSATNDGNAGGLVGKTTGTVYIVNSYAGGHTKDTEYQDQTAAEKGRINVMGNNSVGGFVGNAKENADTELIVNSCYTTCSAKGPDYATAGFIGSANSGVNISNSYAAGKVFPSVEKGAVNPFAGETAGGTFTDNYYIKGLNDKVNEENAAAACSLSDEDDTNPFNVEAAFRNDANCYDKAITAKFSGKYTFSTISQLNPSLNTADLGEIAYNIATIHFGDWEAEGGIEAMDVEVKNEDEFVIDASTEGTPGEITLVAVGKSSEIAVLYHIELDKDNNVSIKDIAYAEVPGVETHYREGIKNKYGKDIPADEMITVETKDGRTHFYITIDSITKPGLHFDELFCTDDPATGLLPGEDVRLCVVSGLAEWADVKDLQKEDAGGNLVDAYAETNSIFAESSETKGSNITAHIETLRHLQNLDSCVSGVNTIASPAAVVKAAELDDHLLLDGEFGNGGTYEEIYASGVEDPVKGSFHAIYNDSLESFNGNLYTIEGLVVDPTISGSNYAAISETADDAAYSLSAGLFGHVENNLRIEDLRLYDPQITSDGNSGALIGSVTGGTVSLNTVAAVGRNGKISSEDASYAAGGLIGSISSARVTVNSSAASVTVHGEASTGGLIGSIDGSSSVTVRNSYVGGKTGTTGVKDADGTLVGHEYRTSQTDKTVYNIYSESSGGGGFVGAVAGSGSLNISDSFCAASVAANSNGGGIIGQIKNTANVELEKVYSTAPVYNVTSTSVKTRGAFVGSVAGSAKLSAVTCAYLPGVYKENYDAEGLINFDELNVKTIGQGSCSGEISPVRFAERSIISAGSNNNCTEPVPYDSTLKTQDYPFAITTVLPFRKVLPGDPVSINAARARYYYGDWQPVFSDSLDSSELDDSKLITVSLVIIQPDGTEVPITGYLSKQDILQKSGGDIVLPSIPAMGGYKPSGWYYEHQWNSTDEYEAGKGAPIAIGTGTATIPDAETDPNRPTESFKLYACYEPANTYEVSFYYVDPTTGNPEALGSPKVYDGETTISNPPTKNFDGYRQKTEGGHLVWYTDPEGKGTPIDVKNMKIEDWPAGSGNTIRLYAIYEDFDVAEIVIQFLYMPAGSTEKWSIPGLGNYVIEYEKGNVFRSTIDIPDLSKNKGNLLPDSATMVNGSGATVQCNSRLDKTNLKFTVDSSVATRYTVIYQAHNTENNYVLHAVYHDSTTGLAYSKGSTYTVNYPGLGAAGYIPDISDTVTSIINANPGFYIKGYTNDKPIPSEGQLDINIDFYRESYDVIFDAGTGTDLITSRLMYGEPLLSYKDAATLTAQKQRNIGSVTYKLNSWNTVRYSNNTPYDGSTMPAFDLLATANWNGIANYKVYYWLQNADIKDASGNNIYDWENAACFNRQNAYSLAVADSLAAYSGNIGASVNLNTLTSKVYDNYHISTRNTPENVNNGVTIKADGSTIINIYYDRDIHSVYFVNGSELTKSYDKVTTSETMHDKSVTQISSVSSSYKIENVSGKYVTRQSSSNDKGYAKYYYDGNGHYYQYSGTSKYETIRSLSTSAKTYYYYNDVTSSLSSDLKSQMSSKGFYKDTNSNTTIYYSTVKADYYYEGGYSGSTYQYSGPSKINNQDVYVYTKASSKPSGINSKGFWKESAGGNIYTHLTITGRWGQDVHDMWPSQRNVDNNYSIWSVSPGSSTWQAFINTVPITDMYFYKKSQDSSSNKVDAYLQNIDNNNYTISADHSYVAECSSANVTTKDDYPPITGFTILAYDSTDASSINSKFGAGTAKYDKNSTNKSTTIGSSFGRGVKIYYERNSYTLYLSNIAANKTVANIKFGTAIKNTSVDGTALQNYVPAAPAGYANYNFAGWYDNSQCAGEPVNWNSITMPASDMVLYAKWTPPVYALTFHMNLASGMSASDVAMTGTNPANVSMKSTVSSNSDLYDANDWKAAYKPTTSESCEYKFKGWYTDPACTMVFKPDAPVTGPIDLYARWVKRTAELKVRHIWLDETGGEHDIAPVQTATVNVDENLTITLHATNNTDQIHLNINGADLTAIDFYDQETKYYQVNTNTVINHRIEGGSSSSEVAFYYNKYNSESWNYSVEYYAEFTNPADPTDSVTILLETVNGGKADKHYKVVGFEMPADLTGYHNTGSETCVVNQGNNKAIFYVAPDLTALSITAEAAVYDGTAHKNAKVSFAGGDFISTAEATAETPASMQAPAGCELFLRYNYSEGERDYIDFGSYSVTANIVFKNGDREVPIWNSDTVYIPIKKRTVTLESISYGWVFDGNLHRFGSGTSEDEHPVLSTGAVLTNVNGPAVYVKETFDDEHGFVPGEGYSFDFDSTAYRTNEGQTENKFAYTLNSNTLAKNYTINVSYGIIKVAGSFSGLGDDILVDGYKVYFHANDGSGTDEIIEHQMESGVAAQLPANPFVHDGYSFVEWNSAPDGNGDRAYTDKMTVIDIAYIETGVIDLYAQWDGNLYEVTFNENGGSGSVPAITAKYGVPFALPDAGLIAPPTGSVKYQSGWSDTADGSGTVYEVGAEVADLTTSASIELFAQWADSFTYNIKFNKNNDAAKGSMDDQTGLVAGVETELYENKYTLDYHDFDGWMLAADDTEAAFADKAHVKRITSTSGDVTLYAKWIPHEYSVKLETNGGYITDGKGVTGHYYGEANALPAEEDMELYGRTFAGWYADEEFSGSPVTEIAADVHEDTTLYAKWTNASYKVTFFTNDGSEASTETNYTFGTGLTLTAPADLEGRSFTGWYTDPEATGSAVTEIGADEYGDKVFYAGWTNGSYTISYVTNGGTFRNGTGVSGYTYGEPTALPSSEDIGKTGYYFGGWFEDPELAGTVVTHISSEDYGNKTFYAKWVSEEYSIHYMDGANEITGQNPAGYSFSTTDDVLLSEASKNGYTFIGWYTNSSFSGSAVTKIAAGSTGDKTFYAKFEANSYTITYMDGDTQITGLSPAGYTFGTAVFLPDTYSKDNCNFEGWYTNSDFSGEPVTMVGAGEYGNKIYYAKTTLDQFEVTFNPNGGSVDLEDKMVTYGGTYGELPVAQKNNSAFLGWFTAINGGDKIESNTRMTRTADHTLYAHWAQVRSFKISVDDYSSVTVGYTTVSGEMETETIQAENDKVEKTINVPEGTTVKVNVDYVSGRKSFSLTKPNRYYPYTTDITFYSDEDCTQQMNNVASEGETTFYFTMPANDVTLTTVGNTPSSGGGGECITGDTLVTMEDGSKLMVKNIKPGDMIQTYDFFTGSIVSEPVIAMEVNKGEIVNEIVIALANGSHMNIIESQSVFDMDTREFFVIDRDNYKDCVGRNIMVSTTGGAISSAAITRAEASVKTLDTYEIATANSYSFFANDMLTVEPFILCTGIFDINDEYRYDEASMAADIAKYGLYTYEDFADVMSREMFDVFNVSVLKVAVGKGNITKAQIYEAIDLLTTLNIVTSFEK